MLEQIYKRNNKTALDPFFNNERKRHKTKLVIGTPVRTPIKPPHPAMVCLTLILLLNKADLVDAKPPRSVIRFAKFGGSATNGVVAPYGNSTLAMQLAHQSADTFRQESSGHLAEHVTQTSQSKKYKKKKKEKNEAIYENIDLLREKVLNPLSNDNLDCENFKTMLSEFNTFELKRAAFQNVFNMAVLTGKKRAVKQLLDMDAPVNGEDHKGVTPLLIAASYGWEDIAKTLVQYGAKASLISHQKSLETSVDYRPASLLAKSPISETNDLRSRFIGLKRLHIAALYDGSSVQEILQRGDSPNEIVNGKSPLFFALMGQTQTVEILLQNHADIKHIEPQTGYNCLHIAVVFCPEKIPMLIASGADPNIQDVNRETPAHLAVKHQQINALGTLLLSGADANLPNKNGKSTLHLATDKLPESVPLLLRHGAKVNVVDKYHNSPLITAMNNKDPITSEILINEGALINREMVGKLSEDVRSMFSYLLEPRLRHQDTQEWNSIKRLYFKLISGFLLILAVIGGLIYFGQKNKRYKEDLAESYRHRANILNNLSELTNEFYNSEWQYDEREDTFQILLAVKTIEQGFNKELVNQRLIDCLRSIFPAKNLIRDGHTLRIVVSKTDKIENTTKYKKRIQNTIKENSSETKRQELAHFVLGIQGRYETLSSLWQTYCSTIQDAGFIENTKLLAVIAKGDSKNLMKIKKNLDTLCREYERITNENSNIDPTAIEKDLSMLVDFLKENGATKLAQFQEFYKKLDKDIDEAKSTLTTKLNSLNRMKKGIGEAVAKARQCSTKQEVPKKIPREILPVIETQSLDITPEEQQIRPVQQINVEHSANIIAIKAPEEISTCPPPCEIDMRHQLLRPILLTPPRPTLPVAECPAGFFTEKNINLKSKAVEKPSGTVDHNTYGIHHYLSKIEITLTQLEKSNLDRSILFHSLFYSIMRFIIMIRITTLLLDPKAEFTKDIAILRNSLVHFAATMDFNESTCNAIVTDAIYLRDYFLTTLSLICNERRYLEPLYFSHLEKIVIKANLENLDLLKLSQESKVLSVEDILLEINSAIRKIREIARLSISHSLIKEHSDVTFASQLLIFRIAQLTQLLEKNYPVDAIRLEARVPTIVLPVSRRREEVMTITAACRYLGNKILQKPLLLVKGELLDKYNFLSSHLINHLVQIEDPLQRLPVRTDDDRPLAIFVPGK